MPTIVICPHPPLLLPGTGGAADAGADLRRTCVETIGEALVARPALVHLVGAGGDPWPGSGMPLSLTVGSRLLDLAGWDGERVLHALPEEPDPSGLDGAAVLLLGDGSARRSERAPGHLDLRAEEFDERIERALAEGDAAALASLDEVLGEELMAAGTGAFRALGCWGLVRGVTEARLLLAQVPYGVAYWVAVWRLGPSQ